MTDMVKKMVDEGYKIFGEMTDNTLIYKLIVKKNECVYKREMPFSKLIEIQREFEKMFPGQTLTFKRAVNLMIDSMLEDIYEEIQGGNQNADE